jgi:hypothetical protein
MLKKSQAALLVETKARLHVSAYARRRRKLSSHSTSRLRALQVRNTLAGFFGFVPARSADTDRGLVPCIGDTPVIPCDTLLTPFRHV